MSATTRVIIGIALIVVTLGGLLPTGIAVLRSHPKTVSVVLWNTLGMLLLGLGWLVALVLALTDPASPPAAIARTGQA